MGIVQQRKLGPGQSGKQSRELLSDSLVDPSQKSFFVNKHPLHRIRGRDIAETLTGIAQISPASRRRT
jgi:hypothetical protein